MKIEKMSEKERQEKAKEFIEELHSKKEMFPNMKNFPTGNIFVIELIKQGSTNTFISSERELEKVLLSIIQYRFLEFDDTIKLTITKITE